jgi:hypothetical protein
MRSGCAPVKKALRPFADDYPPDHDHELLFVERKYPESADSPV